MSSVVPLAPHIIEVRYQQLVINEGTHPTGPHVVHTIEVRHINSPLIRRGIRVIVFIHVQTEKNDINTIQVLEDNDALATVFEFGRVILE